MAQQARPKVAGNTLLLAGPLDEVLERAGEEVVVEALEAVVGIVRGMRPSGRLARSAPASLGSAFEADPADRGRRTVRVGATMPVVDAGAAA